MRTPKFWICALLVTAALPLTSCAPDPDAAGPPADTSPGETIRSTALAENLEAPWSVAFYGKIPLVSERDSARILELDAQGDARVVATVDEARPSGEGGLLGIAVREGHLYIYYTAASDNRIARYALEGAPGSLSLGAPEILFEGIPAANNHNGGRIAFGPDGMLYATTGDAGDGAQAQDLASLSGKILRMTPDGAVPNDNPIAGSFVYSYGHRNPQGIAWSEEGAMYATEFGQNQWDELNVITAGKNYGWPEVEGIAGEAGFVDPVQQWHPTDASPSGMAILGGSIWMANLRGERLREVPLNDLAAATEHLTREDGRLRDVVVAPDSTLWVLTNNTDGRGVPQVGDDRLLQIDPVS